MVTEENEDVERARVVEEALTFILMSPSSIMTNQTFRSFRNMQP